VNEWQKRRIIEQAHQHLERLADLKVERQLHRRQWTLPEQPVEPTPKIRSRLDTAPDWTAEIEHAIMDERAFTAEVVAHVIAEVQRAATDDLERATRSLTVELQELRATLAELRATVATERAGKAGEVLDLPRLPRGRDRDLN
jgi:hypothetical protein